jgi:hypothetical protein
LDDGGKTAERWLLSAESHYGSLDHVVAAVEETDFLMGCICELAR